jgi:hypothetical protein
VPSEFEMLVPVVADVGREKKLLLGSVSVSAEGGQFRFTTALRPKKVSIDEDNLLAVPAAP